MAENVIEPATVTTTDADGKVLGETECQPDSYVITTGPRCYIAHEQVYGNGTVIVTIKRRVGDDG